MKQIQHLPLTKGSIRTLRMALAVLVLLLIVFGARVILNGSSSNKLSLCDAAASAPSAISADALTKLSQVPLGTRAVEVDKLAGQPRWCTLKSVRVNSVLSATPVVYKSDRGAIVVLFENGKVVGSSASEGGEDDLFEPKLLQSQSSDLSYGTKFGEQSVISTTGDTTIKGRGITIKAPFAGSVKLDKKGCAYYFAQTLPGYSLRICATDAKPGRKNQGEVIGKSDEVAVVALLWRSKDGSWALVQPSKDYISSFFSAS